MIRYEFYYFPGKYLGYDDFSHLVSEMRRVASYEGISIDTPVREYLKEKIVVIARKKGSAVAYRMAEFIRVPKSLDVLFVHSIVSTPAVFKGEYNYIMLSTLVNNLVVRFRILGNTYVCCVNDSFYDIHKFENDFIDVFPSIVQDNQPRSVYVSVFEYIISNRRDVLGIYNSSEIDRCTYFINNERIIQIGKTNFIKCISNLIKGKSVKKSRAILTPDNNVRIA
ncbi:MAG: hypothetical protein N2746_08225 [Deltaproteobacteria bacterium]|nr:hypothetical protein [Deltaproteobacteria bacterium]